MFIRASILTTLGLLLSLPGLAAAQAVAAPGPGALETATNAYFASLASANDTALAQSTSPTFHVIGTDGKRIDTEQFLGALYAHRLNASTPRQTLRIGTPSISGTSATESVAYSAFDYAVLGGFPILERDYSDHRLTFIHAADGRWLLDEDHVTSMHHYV